MQPWKCCSSRDWSLNLSPETFSIEAFGLVAALLLAQSDNEECGRTERAVIACGCWFFRCFCLHWWNNKRLLTSAYGFNLTIIQGIENTENGCQCCRLFLPSKWFIYWVCVDSKQLGLVVRKIPDLLQFQRLLLTAQQLFIFQVFSK